MAKDYHIFISHSWDYSDDLKNLRNLLNERGYFNVEFEEVPVDEPINSENSVYIKKKLKEKIERSNIVLGLAGVYASYSDWIAWELKKADDLEIPIIGIIPFGQKNISQVVTHYSKENIHWNTESIVYAIRKWAK